MKNMFLLITVALLIIGSAASAQSSQPLSVKAVMEPQDAIQYDFPTDAPHFVLLVQRTGTLEGEGMLGGAAVTEYGMHDISPGDEGLAQGYIIVETDEGEAFIKYEVQVAFVPGSDGPVALDNGVWHFTGGTQALEGIKGAGTMHIKPVSETDREFSFDGQYVLPEN